MEKERKGRKRKKGKRKENHDGPTPEGIEGYEEEEADGKATSDSNTQDDV